VVFVTIVAVVDKNYRHSREKQERPLRETGAGDEDLAAIADGAFHFTVLDILDSNRRSRTSNYDTRDQRLGFAAGWRWTFGLRYRFAAWSTLLGAFRSILSQRVESEIENAVRTRQSLDHLVDCYWLSKSGHRS
jgi:hypothetical protein